MNQNKKNKKNEDSGFAYSAIQMIEKGLSRVVDIIFAKNNFTVFPKGELTQMWQEVEELDPKMAVIEADKIVDTVLKRAGIRGESLAERLRNIQKLVSRRVYNDMWEAHKVRNRLVHEFGHRIDVEESAKSVWKMKRFLTDLGAFKNE